MKFSIIIPVYNVEKYIIKCLKSIYEQSYKNYEVIIVNDGSPDNCEDLIKNYIKNKKNFKYFKKENGGLSDARNYGVKYATGDYIIFVDSDDYVENKLLEKINKEISNVNYDLIRFNLNIVDEHGNIIEKPKNLEFKVTDKYNIIKSITNNAYVEPAWLYAYKTNFWKSHEYKYPKGKIHEDFGLTPQILSECQKIGYVNYRGYNYVIRNNSIMNQADYKKLHKRTQDFVEEYLTLTRIINIKPKENKLILNYCTSAVIYKLREINEYDCKQELNKLKKEQFLKNYYIINLKTFLIKIKYKLFLTIIIKKQHKRFLKQMEK